jgi:hypothetical protein
MINHDKGKDNEFGSAKHENGTRRPRNRRKRVWESKTCKRDPTPSVPPKTSPGAQNMKTGPYALGTAENKSGSAKHENGTPRLQYRRKRVRSAKHENGTLHPRNRGKRVREHKT